MHHWTSRQIPLRCSFKGKSDWQKKVPHLTKLQMFLYFLKLIQAAACIVTTWKSFYCFTFHITTCLENVDCSTARSNTCASKKPLLTGLHFLAFTDRPLNLYETVYLSFYTSPHKCRKWFSECLYFKNIFYGICSS